jgi:hypothetical protein
MNKQITSTGGAVRALLPLALTVGVAILVLLLAVEVGAGIVALIVPEDAIAASESTETPLAVTATPQDVLSPTTTAIPNAPVPPTPTAQPTELPTSVSPTALPPRPYLVTSHNSVNIRRGPSTWYNKIGSLKEGMELPVTGRMGEWWQVEVADDVGFVSGEFVIVYEGAQVPELGWEELPGPTLDQPVFVPAPTWAIQEERWIDVDLSEQRVTAYEGQTPVKSYLVSTGLPRTPTPEGQFRIWIKLRYDDMAGADYYLEDVPWVMYFYRGYGFHGVWWHGNWGHPMSHGCINQPNDMAEWLFSFAELGTLVNIHE